MNNWFAVYTNSRAEKKVVDSLGLKGLKCYLPLIKSVRIWSDRKKIVSMPLINGYVFVYVNEKEKADVLRTKGVVGFVCFLGKHAIITNEEIERLQMLIEKGYHIESGAINANYTKGQKIEISTGVLKGLRGYIERVQDDNYFLISLDSIGQVLRVKLPAEILKAVSI